MYEHKGTTECLKWRLNPDIYRFLPTSQALRHREKLAADGLISTVSVNPEISRLFFLGLRHFISYIARVKKEGESPHARYEGKRIVKEREREF